jgi:hypothetical protein
MPYSSANAPTADLILPLPDPLPDRWGLFGDGRGQQISVTGNGGMED